LGVHAPGPIPLARRATGYRRAQRNVDMLWKLGFLKAPLDVGVHSDLNLVREAAARLR